jgi:Endonuclease NucS
MDAILICVNPKKVPVDDAVKHLADHNELYWAVTFPIARDRFSYPIYGYIHMCGGQVEYRVSIRDIVPFSRDHHEDRALKPETWVREWQENRNNVRAKPWKNELVMTEIMPFSYDTYSFHKCDGTKVKQAPQKFVRVLPPNRAPASSAQSGSSMLTAAKSERSQLAPLQNIHEAHLEDLIASDLDQIEPGLKLIGRQRNAGAAGRIDLLCQSSAGDIVVVELKRIGARAAGVVEQTMAYVGWARKHLAGPDQQVRGIIVGGRPDTKLQYAVDGIPNLRFRSLNISIGDAD